MNRKYFKLLILAAFVWIGFEAIAEITITKPLLILTDKNGAVVATGSTSISKAMEKASFLPDGVYTLIRPDVTITVKHELVPVNIPPVAVTGGDQIVKEGDIVFLPCNLSYDSDGEVMKCEWTQIVKSGDPIVEILYTTTGTAYYVVPSKTESCSTEYLKIIS